MWMSLCLPCQCNEKWHYIKGMRLLSNIIINSQQIFCFWGMKQKTAPDFQFPRSHEMILSLSWTLAEATQKRSLLQILYRTLQSTSFRWLFVIFFAIVMFGSLLLLFEWIYNTHSNVKILTKWSATKLPACGSSPGIGELLNLIYPPSHSTTV